MYRVGLVSSLRCTCMSIQPGVTVAFFRSTTLSPAAEVAKPFSTETILFPCTMTVMLGFASLSVPLMSAPHQMMVRCAERKKQRKNVQNRRRNFLMVDVCHLKIKG